ncbi:MAG: phosphonate C-P lyase system protein PhnH [Oceanidesulfovibrio sp.]
MLIEPVWTDAVQQTLFRNILEATARPGRIVSLENCLGAASARTGVLATLVDGAVTMADPHRLLREEETLFLQSPSAACEDARFILASGTAEPDFTPRAGDLENPEFGATLVLEVDLLSRDHGPLGLVCTGPGIESEHRLFAAGLSRTWMERRREWNAYFPMGVDIYLVDEARVAALPRTTCIRTI